VCELQVGTGNIIVDKVTDPPGVHDVFTFVPSWGDNFTLTDADTPEDSGPLLPTSISSTYSIAETVPDGWDLSDVTCVGDSPEDPGAIDLGENETVTCTFSNTQRGVIRVVQESDPPGSTKEFHFFPSWDGDFLLSAAGAPYVSDPLPSSVIDGTTYQLSIQSEPDWVLTEIACTGFTSENPAAIFLDPGEIVTCVITHRIKRGRIIVEKFTDPPGSPQAFGFSLTGNNVNQAFSLSHSEVHDSGDLIPTSENGTYNVTETIPENWDLESATCNDASSPAAIDLVPDETVICTFTNFSDLVFGSGFETTNPPPDP